MFTFIETIQTFIMTLIIASPLIIYYLYIISSVNKDNILKHYLLLLFGRFLSRGYSDDETNKAYTEHKKNEDDEVSLRVIKEDQIKSGKIRKHKNVKDLYPTSVLSPLHWFTNWGMGIIYIVSSAPLVWVMVKFINHVLFAQSDPMTWTDSNQSHFERSFWLFIFYIFVSWIWVFCFTCIRNKILTAITGIFGIQLLVSFYIILGITLHNFGVYTGKFYIAYWLTLGYVILVAGVGSISCFITIGEYLFTDKKKTT